MKPLNFIATKNTEDIEIYRKGDNSPKGCLFCKEKKDSYFKHPKKIQLVSYEICLTGESLGTGIEISKKQKGQYDEIDISICFDCVGSMNNAL